MEIDFSKQLRYMGKIITLAMPSESTESDGKEELPCTLKTVAIEALLSIFPDEKPDGRQAYLRGKIAEKISQNDVVNLRIEEIFTIRKRIGKCFGANVVCPAWELLDV